MDNVGELPAGYPHLPNYNFELAEMVKQSLEPKAEAWNDAGTKPDHPCLCETRLDANDTNPYFQKFSDGKFLSLSSDAKSANRKKLKSAWQHVQWREVQP